MSYYEPPATQPNWDNTDTNVSIPPGGLVNAGWANDDVPPAGEVNWFWKLVSDWIRFIATFSWTRATNAGGDVLGLLGASADAPDTAAGDGLYSIGGIATGTGVTSNGGTGVYGRGGASLHGTPGAGIFGETGDLGGIGVLARSALLSTMPAMVAQTLGAGWAFIADASGGTGHGAVLAGNATSAPLWIVPLASAPSGPVEGDLYVDSTSHHVYAYLVTAWKQLD